MNTILLLLFFLLVIHGQFAIDASRIVVESHDRTSSVRDRLEALDLLRESLYDSGHDFHLNFHVEFDELAVFFVVLSIKNQSFTYLLILIRDYEKEKKILAFFCCCCLTHEKLDHAFLQIRIGTVLDMLLGHVFHY